MKNISILKFLISLQEISDSHSDDILIISSSEEEALAIYKQCSFFQNSKREVLYLPSFDSLPYDRVSPSPKILAQRAYVLTRLAISRYGKILIINAPNLITKLPLLVDLQNCYKAISCGDKITPIEVECFLTESSYQKTSCATDPGEFSRRGDILDVVLFSRLAYRINFGWDRVESIRLYDPETQISKDRIEILEIYPASELILKNNNIENYKNNIIKYFGVNKAKERYFEDIIDGVKVHGIESLAPMFYKNTNSILNFLKQPKVFFYPLADHSLNDYLALYRDFYSARANASVCEVNFYPAISPDYMLYSKEEVIAQISDKNNLTGEMDEDVIFLENFHYNSSIKESTAIELFLDLYKKNNGKIAIICARSLYALEQIKILLDLNQLNFNVIKNIQDAKKNIINLVEIDLFRGFMSSKYIVVSDIELIGERQFKNKSSRTKLKNIFKEIESFCEGDLVVHIDHGVGRYETIEQVLVDNIKHDCLKLIYARGDRLFIPVENIALLKRYGSNDVELDHLGGVSWQKRKSKLKDRVGEIAQNLMKIAAKRAVVDLPPVFTSDSDYSLFAKKFPYIETEDQIKAIDDIIRDLEQPKPMDRLICGDVGFGKTEVAMRAAFLVARNNSNKKQVAIIVPTTILARQHYNNFIERFYGFDLKIAQISRFVPIKEISNIKEAIKAGEIDIVIGTHAILSENLKFKNLGLVIVDEEQHFGVLQKEKLKSLREYVHNLTLSATPIPRTLQMSLLGIKDLSLIATAPIDRLPVRTSLISYDEVIIRDALLREKFRGGKSFFVCPRVSDLEEIASNLKVIVPELSLKIIHGQMKSKTIDEIMTEFYDGKFDILLSTAIVESGLDVPSANTIIIYKAEMFGLSQLYQLRGRVGRAKIRGYSYLVLDRKKMPTKSALKRLSIIESLDSLGAGFSIASHDMDLRGFGNLVGDEQSGHIKEVGAELYQEMLEEAIAEVKNEQIANRELPNIKMNIPIFIPEDYIKDSDLRLGIYRRIGDIKTVEEVDELKAELLDRFGAVPLTVTNLLEIMNLKVMAAKINLLSLEIGTGGINVQFSSNINADKIMDFISENSKNTKLKPENRLTIIRQIKAEDFLRAAKEFILNF